MRVALIVVRLGLIVMYAVAGVTAGEDTMDSGTASATDLLAKDSEAAFLAGLHSSHEELVRLFASLPRDEGNKVDWERATAEGRIRPLAAIDENSSEEKIFDLRVVIKFDDMLVKDVVFSHVVHTYWLDCSSCHPKLFKPEIAANRMTMQEIREGKYCGKCHGMVAFPTDPHSLAVSNFRAVCKRCHREKRE